MGVSAARIEHACGIDLGLGRLPCGAQNLEMFTMERRHQDASREVALKRKLIQAPDQPFWEGTARN